jgi:DNA-binding Lrp family transcriptional regulator
MSRKSLDKNNLPAEILTHLRRQGATTLLSLRDKFLISQPTASRLLNKLKNDIVVIGKARDTRYAALRKIDNHAEFPIYEILHDGSSRHVGTLYPIYPQGFYFLSTSQDATSSLYPDLPYFLNDARPAGYLGRLIPLQNEDLQLPKDINLWTADHCLKYLSARGWNIIGNLIVGEKAFQLYLENCRHPQHTVNTINRKTQYPLYANDVLSMGDAGSSAGGEQPKFTTIVLPEHQHVIVKFSPPTTTDIGIRIADLLICEYIALRVLKKHGQHAADAEIIEQDNRIFLEVKRFDRQGKFSRLGVISLASLDAEFSAKSNSWSSISIELAKNKIIPECLLETIRFRELFGACIANNDMHSYNLSFITSGQRVTGLSPAYDMTCMLFMPRNYQIVPVEFNPPLPHVTDKKILTRVIIAAIEFWNEVINDDRISPSFKIIAKNCLKKIAELQGLVALLPNM